MAVNRGKKFEDEIHKQLLTIPDISVDRIYDAMGGFSGINNICDFTLYSKPYFYYIECKSIHKNTLNFKSDIRKNQWEGLLEKSKIKGVVAGILVWFIDLDITLFIPIQGLVRRKEKGFKSFNVGDSYLGNCCGYPIINLRGKKKRVFINYDMEDFLKKLNLLSSGKQELII